MTGPTRGVRNDVAGTLLPGFEGPVLPEWLAARLRGGLAGVCLFGSNIRSLDQLRLLTASVRAENPFAIIAIDEEGGDVTRLFYDAGSPWPGNALLGRLDDTTVTEQTARAVGAALADSGVNLDFAPDVDVNSNDLNPVIGVRSFAATAGVVARHTEAWVRGLQSTGVAASAKHFPGHGDTTTDSHRELPVLDLSPKDLRSREFEPFRAAIAAGTRTIMTSHILLPQLDADQPATFSTRILDGILRRELGFEGVIVSDALDMAGASKNIGIPEAAVRALSGGCDLLCIGTDNTDDQLSAIENAVVAAVSDGRLRETRLAQAAVRVGALARELGDAATDARGPGREAPCRDVQPVSPQSLAQVFEHSPAARATLSRTPFQREDLCLVRLDTIVSPAIGEVPWGPFAFVNPSFVATEATAHATANALARLSNEAPGTEVVIVGRSNHLEEWARRFIDAVRAQPGALVIDMGWPSADRTYADIATFGASRLVGEAAMWTLAHDCSADPLLMARREGLS